jgi:WD40 repeat protein
MAPEQAAGRSRELSPAADIYSLGAILYEMLTGKPPFRAGTPLETLMQVLERTPLPPRQLNPKLDRDLEIICLKCLDKRPHCRYRSAEQLAEDLENWIEGKPIRARSVGRAEHLWLWCRRKPLLAGLGIAVAILAIVAGGLGIRCWVKIVEEEYAQLKRDEDARQEKEQRESLARAAREAEKEKNRQKVLADEADQDRQRHAHVAKAAEDRLKQHQHQREEANRIAAESQLKLQAEKRAREAERLTPPAKPEDVAAYLAAMRRAALQAERQQTGDVLRTLDSFRPKPGQPDLRRWEWHFLHAVAVSQELAPVRLRVSRPIHDLPINITDSPLVAWGKDSGPLAVLDKQGDVHLLDAVNGKLIRILANGAKDQTDIQCYRGEPILVSPDGRWLAQTFRGRRGRQMYLNQMRLKLWDLAKGTVSREFSDVSLGVGWSPDGRRLYLGGDRIWDMTTSSEQKLHDLQGKVQCACWNPDGSQLATGGADRTLRFWDMATGKEAGECLSFGQAVAAVAWSSTGKWLAVAAGDTISVWDMPARKQRWRLLYGFSTHDCRLKWRLDGQGLDVYGGGGAYPHKLLEGATGREIFTSAPTAAYCPDGKRIAVLDLPNFAVSPKAKPRIRILDIDSGQESLSISGVERGLLTWNSDGKLLALASDTGMLHIWSIAPSSVANSSLSLANARELAWSPDSLRYALAPKDPNSDRVLIGTLAHPEISMQIEPRDADAAGPTSRYRFGQILNLAWSPDGKHLATTHKGSCAIYLWEVASGKPTWRLAGHTKETGGFLLTERGNSILALAWSPSGRWLASAAENATVKVWDTIAGKEASSFDLEELTSGGNRLELSWSADGKYLAASPWMGLTRVWEIPVGRLVSCLKAGPAVMSPDRKMLALAGGGSVKLWDLTNGKELPPREGGDIHRAGRILAWSPDGRYLVYSSDRTCIWDVQSRSRVEIGGSASHAAWEADSKQVLVLFGSGRLVKVFKAPNGEQVRDYGPVTMGLAPALPQLLWTREGPRLAMPHEIRITPKGLRIRVKTGPNYVGEKSADQGVVEIVDLATGKSRFTLQVLQADPPQPVDDPLKALAWKRDGMELATVHQDTILRLWHPITGQALRRLPSPQQILRHGTASPPLPYRPWAALAWSPDGKRVAYADGNWIRVWDLTDEKKSMAFQEGGVQIQSLAWSPDSRRLAALANGGRDAVVKIWDTTSWRELHSFDLEGIATSSAAKLLCWSPDGKQLAAGVQSIRLWDAETGKDPTELAGHTLPLERLEWSDDGRRIISRAATRPKGEPAVQELIVWDAALGEQLLKLGGAAAEYRISPDGNWLAMPTADNGGFRLQHLSHSKE